QIGALPAFRIMLEGIIYAGIGDRDGRIEIRVSAPLFLATAVVEIARHPDVARVADDPYRAKRAGSKIRTDQRVGKQDDIRGRVELLDQSVMQCDLQAEARRDRTHDVLEQG